MKRLADLYLLPSPQQLVQANDGSEVTAATILKWLDCPHMATLFIQLGRPFENSYNESSNGKLLDELIKERSFARQKKSKS